MVSGPRVHQTGSCNTPWQAQNTNFGSRKAHGLGSAAQGVEDARAVAGPALTAGAHDAVGVAAVVRCPRARRRPSTWWIRRPLPQQQLPRKGLPCRRRPPLRNRKRRRRALPTVLWTRWSCRRPPLSGGQSRRRQRWLSLRLLLRPWTRQSRPRQPSRERSRQPQTGRRPRRRRTSQRPHTVSKRRRNRQRAPLLPRVMARRAAYAGRGGGERLWGCEVLL